MPATRLLMNNETLMSFMPSGSSRSLRRSSNVSSLQCGNDGLKSGSDVTPFHISSVGVVKILENVKLVKHSEYLGYRRAPLN